MCAVNSWIICNDLSYENKKQSILTFLVTLAEELIAKPNLVIASSKKQTSKQKHETLWSTPVTPKSLLEEGVQGAVKQNGISEPKPRM